MNQLRYQVIFFFSFFQQSISKSFFHIQPAILKTLIQVNIFDFQDFIFLARFFNYILKKITLFVRFLYLWILAFAKILIYFLQFTSKAH
jgi:hypothetical protein